MNDDVRIEFDKRGILVKLAFLVGKTLAIYSSDGFEAVKVNSVRVTDGADVELFIYTTSGVLCYQSKELLKDTFLITDTGMKSLLEIAEDLEVYF